MRILPARLLARLKSKKILALIFLVLPLGLLSTSVMADTFAKTFGADKPIAPGYVVAITKNDQSKVELASAKELTRIYGLVINPSDSAVTLQTGNGQVVVATSGNYPILVSLSGGVIRTGDYLSVSSVDGIAAKASPTQDTIIARALGDFSGSQGVISGSGNQAVGKIDAQVVPGKNPLSKNDQSVSGPVFKLADSLAGRPVSPQRVYTALGVFLITLIIASSLIYVGVRTSMISIGRNPLSKHSIMRGLTQVIFAAGLVFACGLVGVYILIKG